jgi:hypothetical protein
LNKYAFFKVCRFCISSNGLCLQALGVARGSDFNSLDNLDNNYVNSFKGAPFIGSFLEIFAWSYNFLGGNYSTGEGVWIQSPLGKTEGIMMHNEDGSLVWWCQRLLMF